MLFGSGYWFIESGFDFRQVLLLILGLAFVAMTIFLLRRDAKDELKRSRKASAMKKQWNLASPQNEETCIRTPTCAPSIS
jgi:hypothetical protein